MATDLKYGDDAYVVDVSLPSSVLVYGLINHDNDTLWDGSTLRLSTPIINPNADKNRNTRVFAVALPGAVEQGSTYFWYDRISLSYYLSNFPTIDIQMDESWTTTHDLIPWFNSKFGLGLEKTDVRSEFLDTTPNAENWFNISGTSLAWMDGVLINLLTDKVDISTLEGTPVLDGVYTTTQASTIYGPLYGFALDTTAPVVRNQLFLMNQTKVSNGELATLLTTLDQKEGNNWVHVNSPDVCNTFEAVMVYNGTINGQTTHPARTGYTHVLVVDMSGTYCTNFHNSLVIYYNQV